MKNPINSVLLRLALKPAFLYKKLDVDLGHLKAILSAKLIMDDRRASGLYKVRRQNQDKEISSATLFTALISLVFGLTLCVVFFLKDDLTRMTLYFGMFGFVLSLFMITDFSDILIDPKDNFIILPKPITSSTFTVSRLLHIWIHLTKIVVPMSLCGFLFTLFSKGILGAIGFLICILLLTLLTFAFVNAIYLLIIRIFSPGKLNAIITNLQIVFSVVMYGSYQVLPRLLDKEDLAQLVLYKTPLMWLLPVYWMGKAWVFFYTWNFHPDLLLGVFLSVVAPVVGIWMVVKFLAPSFFRKISMIHSEVTVEKKDQAGKTTLPSKGISFLLARLFTSKGIEQASFLFTWQMTARARDFKMRVYPQIGYLLVIIVFFSFRTWKQLLLNSASFEYVDDSKVIMLVLTLIYFSTFIFIGAIMQLPFSEQYKAGWIYFISPLQNPGVLVRGAIKACLSKYLLFPILIVTCIGLFLFNTSIIPNLLFGFGNILLISVAFSWLAMNRLPFSVSIKNQVKGGFTMRNLFLFIMLPVFGFPHYFLFHHPVLLISFSVITIPLGLAILYYTKNISWSNLMQAEN